MLEDVIKLINDSTESDPFSKSREYLMNAQKGKYTPEEAMRLMLKEPTVFLAPVIFVMFTSDTRLDIKLFEYASIIMKQAKQKNNKKLYDTAKASYKIGRKANV
ncbi:hypothetical protein [Cytobacillus gottheilii]|uniref:hypothetical protein n=1 Tax=Cytobacillus gottheilii TaxID=859144 RepID=UPI0008318855|nr:hypothetical protein [Cytobacillus gottheilii]